MLASLPAPPRQLGDERRLVMLEAPTELGAEAIRMLRTNLEFAALGKKAQMIMVSSALEKEGKSTTLANLAVALARSGQRVILADFDLRRPVVDQFFGVDARPGVTDVAVGHADLDEALRSAPISAPAAGLATRPSNGHGSTDDPYPSLETAPSQGSLHVLTSGPIPPDPGEFVSTDRVAEILASLRERADLVLIDVPPLLHVGDAMVLSAKVDAVLLVARMGALQRPMVDELKRIVDSMPAATLGFVVTGTESQMGYGYGYAARAYARLGPRHRFRSESLEVGVQAASSLSDPPPRRVRSAALYRNDHRVAPVRSPTHLPMDRILHVNKFAHVVGGVETHIDQLMAQQASAGSIVELFTSEDVAGPGFSPARTSLSGRAASLATLLWSRAARTALRQRIRAFRPDVIHYHSIYHHLSPSVLVDRQVTSVMTLHDYKLAAPCYLLFRDGNECTLCVGRSFPAPAVRYRCVKDSVAGSLACAVEQTAHKGAYRNGVHAFIVPSDAARRHLSESKAVDSRRLHVVPHGVVVPARSAPLADSPPRVVFVGRLAPEKGMGMLLDAWISAALPEPWELVIAGDGPERAGLERRAHLSRVRFLGHVESGALARIFEQASVVVLPSQVPETFGLSVAEAMAQGVPVLVSDSGNLPDLVNSPEQVVPARDVRAWRDALTWIAESRNAEHGLGAPGANMFDGHTIRSWLRVALTMCTQRRPAFTTRP